MPQYTRRRSTLQARIPNRIREYRLRAGLSQAGLGALVGRGRSLVSAWERGASLPSLPNVFRLARALSTLAEALYGALYFPKRDKDSDREHA